MRNPMKMKGKNHRRRYMYVKLRECDTTVVNMSTSVEIVQIENKTSTVRTLKIIYTLLNNGT